MAATAYKAGAIAKTSVLDIRAVEHLTERKGSLLIGQDDKFIWIGYVFAFRAEQYTY